MSKSIREYELQIEQLLGYKDEARILRSALFLVESRLDRAKELLSKIINNPQDEAFGITVESIDEFLWEEKKLNGEIILEGSNKRVPFRNTVTTINDSDEML